jgi:NADH-quinone oxidoreductase subunit C
MFTFESVKEHIPDFSYEAIDVNGTPAALLKRDKIVEVAKIVKEKFDFLQLIDAFGIDRNERKDRFEITYSLRNHKTSERIFLKVRCDEKDPHVPSLVAIWTGANWNEREAYDMYGVIFDGHPDLRRMYMPEEYAYHPLRKDFPLMGIPGSIPLPRSDGSEDRFHIPDRGE